MCMDEHFRQIMDQLTQKSGYMDVKQSSRVRGRKLKTWRRRWVVFTKMSNLSSDEIVGKLDLYENEEKWKTNPSNKVTFILENVTAIRQSTSRTHPHAFEIIEQEPTIVLSGTTELESYSWLLSLQQIFTPAMVENIKDCYTVSILPNEDSLKWKLEGQYGLTVSENGVSLVESSDSSTGSNVKISWGLSTLMRFTMEKEAKTEEESKVLVIKCGPNSPTGDSTFKFLSDEVKSIIRTIRHFICIALAHKQNIRHVSVNSRLRSISATYSEKNFLNMLDTQAVFHDTPRDRSGSDSSGSTLPLSPSTNALISEYLTQNESYFRPHSRISNSDLGVLDEADEQNSSGIINNNNNNNLNLNDNNSNNNGNSSNRGRHNIMNDVTARDSGCGSECLSFTSTDLPTSAAPRVKNSNDPGYSLIKDVAVQITSIEGAVEGVSLAGTSHHPSSIDKVSAQVSEELFLPASKVQNCHLFDVDNALDSFKQADAVPDQMISSTYSLEIEGKRKVDPIYQELDKFDRKTNISERINVPGILNRRRSSSTPDLQAFWKKHGFDSDFENVYEELDEHRRSFFTRMQRKEKQKETPPALPARPPTVSFASHPKDHNVSQPIVRLRKSFVGKIEASQEKPWMQHSNKNKKMKACHCHFPRPIKRGQGAKRSKCGECGGKIKHYESIKHWHKSANDTSGGANLTSDPKNLLLNKVNPDSKTSSPDSKTHLSLGRSLSANRCATNYTDSAQSLRKSSSPITAATQLANINDPLIGFFLDDKKFDSNPLVTGQYITKVDEHFQNPFTEGKKSEQRAILSGPQASIESSFSSAFSQLSAASPSTTSTPHTQGSPINADFNYFLTSSWTPVAANTAVFPSAIKSCQALNSTTTTSPSFSTTNQSSFVVPFPNTVSTSMLRAVSPRPMSDDGACLREDSYMRMTNQRKKSNSAFGPVLASAKSDQSDTQASFDPFFNFLNEHCTKDGIQINHSKGCNFQGDQSQNNKDDGRNDDDNDDNDIYVRPRRASTEYTFTDCLLNKPAPK